MGIRWQIGLMISALLSGAPLATADDAVDGWNVKFIKNDKLPKGFRQFEILRSDGSKQAAFLADKSLEKKLPLMIFVDGSGAHSQFFYENGKRGYGLYGALANRAADQYHVATPEKRGVKFGEMGSVGAAENASKEYAAHATLEDRVAEIRLLIDELIKQPAVDKRKVLVFGQSEGADVAAAVAAEDPRVTHLAFLAGGGPTQLFDLIVLRRKEMTKEGATPEAIEDSVRELEKDYREMFADPDNEEKLFMGHAYKRWTSFCSRPPIDSLVRTKAKIFAGHGSEDKAVPIEAFDLLVVDLIRAGKKDVTVRRYPGRDHGLAPPGTNSNSAPLKDIFDEILKWAEG